MNGRKGTEPIDPVEPPRRSGGPPLSNVRRCHVDEQYAALVRNNRLGAAELERLREEAQNLAYRPPLGVLLPVFDPDPGSSERTLERALERTLDSLIAQVYPEWEVRVCAAGSAGERAAGTLSRYERLDGRVKVTTLPGVEAGRAGALKSALSLSGGEFVGLLEAGDELAPDALFEIVKLLQEHPGADLVYSDEDRIDGEGNRSGPYFKPGWSPDLLLSTNYVARSGFYRRSLLEEVGAFGEGSDGDPEYDLALRAAERTDRVYHVPKVLYHRRTEAGYTPTGGEREGARRALSEALERRGLEGSVQDGLLPGSFRAELKVEGEPKVSIIIPSRDNVSMLRNCVQSIEGLTTYRNYEILIVDNDSADPETLEYLASTAHRVVPFREEFNYSKINNFAVSRAEGEYVLLLNDDTEVISGGWLEAMLQHAQRPEIGAVGAKLVYPDGRIQHGGVVVGVGSFWGPGVAMPSHQFYSSDSPGYAGTLAMIANYSAVTAACMLLRRTVFEEVGGLDEENLPVSFNDVDLCLRIRERGYRILYTPHAELLHHESVSRGYRGDPTENLYMRARWGETLDGDPYYHPNFSRGTADYNIGADLLRPKVLRSVTERSKEEPLSLFNPLKRYSYLLDQYGAARGSHRTAIIPKTTGDDAPPAGSGSGENQGPHDRERRAGSPGSTPRDRGGALGAKLAVGGGALRSRLAGYYRKKIGQRGRPRAEQVIWMFGSPRTGSTWLSMIMAELEDQERWHEPYVGLLFGSFLYERLQGNTKLLNSPSFIMGEPHRETWLKSIRDFVLDGAAARYPDLARDQYLVIKEPNGSLGARLLSEATPDSRFIFLIRDPRDVVASRLDAFKTGSWTRQERDLGTTEKLNAQTRHLAEDYLRVVSQVQKAYETHPGRKVLVKYEDLRCDTVGALKTMYSGLGIAVDRAKLEAAVEKHSWENIPESNKGSGKFYRKAQPGSWHEDLSAEQVEIVEGITEPVLSEYYRTSATGR